MRLLLALLCALVSLSLASASVAHAAEASVCVEQVAAHADHEPAQGGDDAVKADPHVGCHGHQLAALPAEPFGSLCSGTPAGPAPTGCRALRATATGPASRPPKA